MKDDLIKQRDNQILDLKEKLIDYEHVASIPDELPYSLATELEQNDFDLNLAEKELKILNMTKLQANKIQNTLSLTQ